MKKGWIIVSALLVIIIVGVIVLIVMPANTANAPTNGVPTETSTPVAAEPAASSSAELADTIVVASPASSAKVTSPLTVTGKARGSFYFEASFPVKLVDAYGTVLAQSPAKAQSDWMTSNFVPFKVTLTFAPQPAGSVGTLLLMNDNPSGDPARQKTMYVRVQF